ncbi:MAG TPA: hypothetical protein VF075_11440 [Pyrinomonadaceae bacterium]
MKTIQVLDRPASQSFYEVAGRLLFIENIDLRLGNLIERLCAGWQLTRVSSHENSADIQIEFFCGGPLPEVPRDLNEFEIAQGGKCYTVSDDLYLTLGDSLLHLQNGNVVTVKIWIEKVPGPSDPTLARVASFAICAALRRFGTFEVHGAGVVHPESDKGVLIIGSSGSGKSTLALQLAKAGWAYLSDDEVLLSLRNGEVEARGFRSFFAVREADDALKTCFQPDTLFACERRSQTIPSLMLFTRFAGEQKTELTKLTQLEAMTRLIRACPWATYDTSIAGDNLEVLSALARQTIAFDLSAGRDLLEPGRASELLSRHTR